MLGAGCWVLGVGCWVLSDGEASASGMWWFWGNLHVSAGEDEEYDGHWVHIHCSARHVQYTVGASRDMEHHERYL